METPASLVYDHPHLAGKALQRQTVAGVRRFDKVVGLAEALVGVQIGLFDEALHGTPQGLGQHLGIESPQKLVGEVHLHIEVVQAVVAEVAVEEGVVDDLVEGLAPGVFEPVVQPEVVAQEPSLRFQLRLQTRACMGLGPAEVERDYPDAAP